MIGKKYFIIGCVIFAALLCSVDAFATEKEVNSVNDANTLSQAAVANDITLIKVGGISIIVPSPAQDLLEVGYDKRELLEIAVPASNRLLSAFLRADDIKKLGSGDANSFSQYAFLEIFRQAEFMDCTPSDFNAVAEEMKKSSVNKAITSSMGDINARMSKRCKDIGVDEIQIGKTEILGTTFTIPDATAIAMVIGVKQNSQTVKMLCSCCLVRVKNRLLYAYVYSQYKDDATLKWVNTTSKSWAQAILKANQGI